MTTIRTRTQTKVLADCVKLTHYPNSSYDEVRSFLNARGMREVLTIPQKMNEYQIYK